MLNYFATKPIRKNTPTTSIDLTTSEIATYIVSALIGMVIVGATAVLMLL